MRLIDADALTATLGVTDMDCDKCAWHDREWSNCKRGGDFEDACCAIENAPTIEERKTGKWVWDENGMDWNLGAWVCSECHARNDNIPPAIKYNDGYRKVGNPYMWQGSKFCPNCGARMVQEGEDNADTNSNHGRLPSSR